jgi:hypothetical protein
MGLKVMFWNIRHLGDTRTKKTEVITEVARFIRMYSPDILCIQELVVDTPNRAIAIIDSINKELKKNSHVEYNYILCPHNGFEIYVYLYKGSTQLNAVVLDNNAPDFVDENTISKQKFSLVTKSTKLDWTNNFPLFDFKDRGSSARAPGIGFFIYQDVNNIKHNLSIFNWHNEAQTGLPKTYIKRLSRVKSLQQGVFKIKIGNQEETFKNIIIGGDFNHNLDNNPFTINHQYVREINDTVKEKNRTHLFKFDSDNDINFDTTLKLRDHRLDNILTKLTTLKASNAKVIDIPDYYKTNLLETKDTLDDSDLCKKIIARVKRKKALINQFGVKSKISKKNKTIYYNIIIKLEKTISFENITDNDIHKEIDKEMGIITKQKLILKTKTTSFINKESVRNKRWIDLSNNINAMLYNDALALTQEWISDHLPISIEFN